MGDTQTRSPPGDRGFADLPIITDLTTLEAEVAILGVPYGTAYDIDASVEGHAAAPAAIRGKTSRASLYHYDFDIGGPVLEGADSDMRIVDCGDIPGGPRPADGSDNRARTTAAVKTILERAAVPIVLGGDDSVPIPFFAAFEGRGPFTVIQVDAHLDWRDEVHGCRYGYSSPMRRASEMAWINGMVQIGLRATGSARASDVADAQAWGSRFVTARTVRAHGIAAALAEIPDGGDFLVTIDCDGIDPGDFPAVGALSPGGIAYADMIDLIRGIAAKGRISGLDIVEFNSAHDPSNGPSAALAARLVLTAISAMIGAQHFALSGNKT